MNKCVFCGYEWTSRVTLPKQCPSCKRYSWFKTVFKHPVPSPASPTNSKEALGINTPNNIVNGDKAKSADINKNKEEMQDYDDEDYFIKED